jgi:uridine kinase
MSEGGDRDALVARIASEIPRKTSGYVLVAVDGTDGSGKTTFAEKLAAELRHQRRETVMIPADNFLNPSQVRYRRGRWSPEGFWLDSYDYPALHRDVIIPLGLQGDGRYRTAAIDPYHDLPFTPAARQAVPGTVVIVEGLFLHRDSLTARWDYSIFLDVPFAVSVRRLADRDGTPADPEHPQMRRYVGGQRLYYRSCHPWLRATCVIDNADPERPRHMTAEEADGPASAARGTRHGHGLIC